MAAARRRGRSGTGSTAPEGLAPEKLGAPRPPRAPLHAPGAAARAQLECRRKSTSEATRKRSRQAGFAPFGPSVRESLALKRRTSWWHQKRADAPASGKLDTTITHYSVMVYVLHTTANQKHGPCLMGGHDSLRKTTRRHRRSRTPQAGSPKDLA